MTKSELERKPLSELHSLAAEAGVEKFRMLSKSELVERLADGDSGSGGGDSGSDGGGKGSRGGRSGGGARGGRSGGGGDERREGERPARRRRRRRPRGDGGADEDASEREAEGEAPRERGGRSQAASESRPTPAADRDRDDEGSGGRPRRRRRRRPFGRRDKGEVTIQGLLLPPEPGRQAILCAETREGCTALLRGVAADIAADSKGPDPIALLIDPSPEELGDWRREAPQAEIVAAGQPRHASDALAQAASRAGSGEDVFLLVDSLTRLAEAYGDADAAKQFFDAGREGAGKGAGGSLTVVAALERPAGD